MQQTRLTTCTMASYSAGVLRDPAIVLQDGEKHSLLSVCESLTSFSLGCQTNIIAGCLKLS